jgi:hypothetical protein
MTVLDTARHGVPTRPSRALDNLPVLIACFLPRSISFIL